MRLDGYDVYFLTGTDEHGHEDAADRGARRHHAARAARSQRAALPRHGRAHELLERRLHPHHRGAPPSFVGRDLGADGAGRRHLPRQVFRLVLGARRGLLRRERDHAGSRTASASARRARRSNGSRRRAISSASRPTRTSCSTSMPGHPGFRAAQGAVQRGGELRAAAACRTCRSRAPPSTGAFACPAMPKHIMYVWVDALTNYITAVGFPDTECGGIPPLLAGRPARDRQGHRALPRGLLAGLPDVGRHRGAAPHLLPRLPVQSRGEDVEVGRQRDRPVRARRCLRGRPAALFLPARGAVRPGRQLQPRGDRGAHQCRPRERPRQPGAALAVDDRAQLRRRPAGARVRSPPPTRRSSPPPTP